MLKENFYQNPFECYDYIPIGVCIINSNYSVIYWNRTLEAWTGKNRNDVLYKKIFDIYPHLASPKYKTRLEMMFSGRPPMVFSPMINHYFFPIKDASGNYQAQTATLTALPTNEQGVFNLVISVENVATLFNRVEQYRLLKNQALDELNKRIETETKIKDYAQKLEQLNATKDKFFSIIAHDLINPISSQYKLTKILKDNIQEFSKEDIVDIVDEIEKSSSHTYKLLENLLTWSRSQLNKFVAKKECFPLREIINLAMADVYPQITVKKINLTIDESCITDIYCDVNMLATVLRNILSNAVKYTNYGGKIFLYCNKNENFTELTIEDNGIGMSEDVLSNLFKIDKSQSMPGTDREIGTGLGLVICKEFIDKLDGHIRAESKLGVGSKFIISLPNCPDDTKNQSL